MMAKGKARAKVGSSGTGRGQGGSGVTAASLLPLFVSGKKIRDDAFQITIKDTEDSEERHIKVVPSQHKAAIEIGEGDLEYNQFILECVDSVE